MIPRARQRVRVAGREGQFLVVWVDIDRRTVDVIPVANVGSLETLSFSEVWPLHGDALDFSGEI